MEVLPKIEEVKIPLPVMLPRAPEPEPPEVGKPMVEHSCCFILYPDNLLEKLNLFKIVIKINIL